MNENKCSFLKKIAYSFNPSAYSILSFQKVGAMLGFVFLFTLLTVFIQFLNFFFMFHNVIYDSFGVTGVEEMMNACIPEFRLQNGKLNVDGVVDASYGGVVVYIDDSLSEVTMSDMDYLSKNTAFDAFLLGSSSNLILYSVKECKYQEIKFSDYKDVNTTKAEVVQYISNVFDTAVVIGVIAWYLLAVCAHFFVALIYFLLFLILNMFVKRRASASQIYMTCVFAIVPYRIVKLVLSLLPIGILSELVNPLYIVSVLVIGGFALYSVHEENYRLDGNMNQFNIGEDYLYVSVNATPVGGSEDAFGGYSAIDSREVVKDKVNKQIKANKTINIKGVIVNKADLEVTDKYIQGNFKEMAVANLQNLTGLSAEECLDVVYNWYQYYQ